MCKKLEMEVLQLRMDQADTITELKQAQECFPLPEIRFDDAEEWLQHMASLAERMKVALGMAARTFWYMDPNLGEDFEFILMQLQGCPTWMSKWQFSSAF